MDKKPLSIVIYIYMSSKQKASLVQLVERWSPKPNVVGSSPTGRAKIFLI